MSDRHRWKEIIVIIIIIIIIIIIKGLTQTEGIWEQGAEEDIWTEEGWGDGRMEKIA
jgi:hypothetical protein